MGVNLEEGLFELCSKRIMADEEFIAVARNRNFCKVNNDLFQEFRLYQLKKTIRHVYENSCFYREKFRERSVGPEDIKSLKDIEKFPFTFPEDLRHSSYDFLCISQRDVENPVTFFSSGTTGIRKRIYFSRADIIKIMQFLPRRKLCACALLKSPMYGSGTRVPFSGSQRKRQAKWIYPS